MRITESQLRRIIRQEVQAVRRTRSLREAAKMSDKDIIYKTWDAAEAEGLDIESGTGDWTEWTVDRDARGHAKIIFHQLTGEEISVPYGLEPVSVTPPPAPGYDAELAKEDKYAGRVKYDPYD